MVDLVKYRLDSAEEKLTASKLLLENGHYKDSISRSYYTIFSAIRALLANDGVDFSKHTGVISYFNKEYIKTGIFGVKFSKYLQSAFQTRNSSDYDDFYIATREQAEEQYQHAVELHTVIKDYLYKLDNTNTNDPYEEILQRYCCNLTEQQKELVRTCTATLRNKDIELFEAGVKSCVDNL